MKMEENSIRDRSTTRSISMVIDAPLPDVYTILNEFNQSTLDSQSLRVLTEIKKISDFQKESIQETLDKSQAMISDILWQRDQLISRIKEECSTRAIELQLLITSFSNINSTRRGSTILKPTYNQPLLEFSKEIHMIKINWLRKNHFSIKFTLNGIEKIINSKNLSLHTSQMYEELAQAPSITQLIINRKLGDDGARHLSHILPYFPNLSILTLTSNCLGPRGGKFIAAGLSSLTKLYKFSINNERIRDGVVSIVRILPNLHNLEEVYLSTGSFYEREAGDIGTAISIMGKLRNFALLGGFLETRGTEKLCFGLFYLTQLKTLDLSGNSFGPGGSEVLCLTLQNLKQLECLKLSTNNFGSQSGACFGILLNGLKRIEEFWLNSNALQDRGVCDFIEKIENQLQILKFQDNEIGNVGAKAVLKKCKEWGSLKNLDLSWNSFDNSIGKVFDGCEEMFKNKILNFCGMNLSEKLLNSNGFTIFV